MKRSLKYFVILWISLLWGCSSDPESERSTPDYLPLQKGVYQIYDVMETRYTIVSDPTTTEYELMTEVVDSTASGKDFIYIIYLYKRDDETQDWIYLDTWSATANHLRAVITDSVSTYVKLNYPLSLGKTWNGNALNSFDEEQYEVTLYNEPYNVNGVSYPASVEVEQSFVDDVIVAQDIRREIYAAGVGLIARDFIQLNYCTQQGCLGQQQIESGISYQQQIKEYGKR